MNHASIRTARAVAYAAPDVSDRVRQLLHDADRAAEQCTTHGLVALLSPCSAERRASRAEASRWESLMAVAIRNAEHACATDADRAALNACLGVAS